LEREAFNILPSELVPASQEGQGGVSSPYLKAGASTPLGMVMSQQVRAAETIFLHDSDHKNFL